MPLQIKELHIKVTVNSDEEQSTPAAGNTGPETNSSSSVNNSEIIADCVEQVMQILKEKMEP
jgi:hypothetical protein